MLTLTRLLNADNEVIGYFSDATTAEQKARLEWNDYYTWRCEKSTDPEDQGPYRRCKSNLEQIEPLPLDIVEVGDDDRLDYLFFRGSVPALNERTLRLAERMRAWFSMGAVSVDVQWFFVNRYRRPGLSNRDVNLGGVVSGAILYVLKVKAPK